jgi:ABC-2 type transport system ATP-binding protein
MNTRAGPGAIGPELLILDEPTNGLDPAGMAEMRTLLRRLGAGGHTVLVSGHPLGEVQQVCDRVGVIAQGRLLRQATVGELRGHSSLRVVAEPLHQARTVAPGRHRCRQRTVRGAGPGRLLGDVRGGRGADTPGRRLILKMRRRNQ